MVATRPRTTQERTYATYYVPDVNGQKGNDQVIFAHPNGLCVVCLSDRHPLCAGRPTAADDPAPSAPPTGKRKRDEDDDDDDDDDATAEAGPPSTADSDAPPASDSAPVPAGVASVDFSCGKDGKGHQTNSAVSGKRKKGAKLLMENSGVARLTDPAGRHWTARACVRGKLLELNERLIREPSLASDDPTGAGFLAVVMPRAEDVEKLARTALTPEAYAKRNETIEI